MDRLRLFGCVWDDPFEAASFPKERSYLTESLWTRMCLRPICKVPSVDLQARETHNNIVWCCGINDKINVRTVTSKLTLETPRCQQGERNHVMLEQDPFQILLSLCSRAWLCAWRRCRKSGDRDGREGLRAGSQGRMAEMRQQRLFLKSFQG